MQEIISAVSRQLLQSELTPDKMLRRTNKAHNEIYIITAHDSPHTMREIGRLREEAFRFYGGGSGLPCDIDEFDLMDNPYKQLIVWNPEKQEILGGYRFLCGNDIEFDAQGKPIMATATLFEFSKNFLVNYLPYTVELGRSFVSLQYQNTLEGSKNIYALDNLWDGLGALSVVDPNIRFFFGKVTMYNTYNVEARNMILYFLKKYFSDPMHLVYPKYELVTNTDQEQMMRIFSENNFKADYRILNREVRQRGVNIPPLVNAYMNLSPQMRMFGTAINRSFGNVEETGILINIEEILEDKKKRHIESYLKDKPSVSFLQTLRKIIHWNKK